MVLPSTEEEDEMDTTAAVVRRGRWNKGKLVGQKAPLKVKDIWAIRVRLQIQVRTRILRCSTLALIASSAVAIW
jgi:hypothetical protein